MPPKLEEEPQQQQQYSSNDIEFGIPSPPLQPKQQPPEPLEPDESYEEDEEDGDYFESDDDDDDDDDDDFDPTNKTNKSERFDNDPYTHKSKRIKTKVDNLAGTVADTLLLWRIVFLIILVVCGVATSIGNHYVLKALENQSQQLQQETSSSSQQLLLLGAVQQPFQQLMTSMQALSNVITSSVIADAALYEAEKETTTATYIQQQQQQYRQQFRRQWSIMDPAAFESHAASIRYELLKSSQLVGPILYAPLVQGTNNNNNNNNSSSDQRQEWQAFIQANAIPVLKKARAMSMSSLFLLDADSSAEVALLGMTPQEEVALPLKEIYYFENNNNQKATAVSSSLHPLYAPVWQVSPPPRNATNSVLNLDLLQTEPFESSIMMNSSSRRGHSGWFTPTVMEQASLLVAYYVQPVISYDNNNNNKVVGLVTAQWNWLEFLKQEQESLFLSTSDDTAAVNQTVTVVLENTCGQSFRFRLTRSSTAAPKESAAAATVDNTNNNTNVVVSFLGEFDGNSSTLEDDTVGSPILILPLNGDDNENMTDDSSCSYTIKVYSTTALVSAASTSTNNPQQQPSQSLFNYDLFWTSMVACVFAFLILFFVLYDCLARQQNSMVVQAANRANTVLSQLFPQQVRDRLLSTVQVPEEDSATKKQQQQQQEKKVQQQQKRDNNDNTERSSSRHNFAHSSSGASLTASFKAALKNNYHLTSTTASAGFKMVGGNEMYLEKPIADLFPATTIMFADISGFTAWSSEREPTQVFILLETVFRKFDQFAKKRGVFKVETVGDCYVAVVGLPEPRKDHAVAMARFARDCMHAMRELTKTLEMTLGPETADLEMRMGLHSGPVTAGVLRGDRSRFQLFGDTMNTASRMESTGMRGRIQLSQETTDLLIAAGKSNWISLREETVVAKGKGELQTYWLAQLTHHSTSENESTRDADETTRTSDVDLIAAPTYVITTAKASRLIDWNHEILLRLLKQIVARRHALVRIDVNRKADADESQFFKASHRALDEVQDVIALPTFDARDAIKEADNIQLDPKVIDQLYDYVSNVAAMYRDNPFHNFEHASHVTMSVMKLLSRIIAPSEDKEAGMSIHDHTYGITNDPLTQFACVLAALIHDVDHPGVPNSQLIKEKVPVADFYRGKSIAEQNSVDLAWHLLMDESYSELRRTIYTTNTGLKRFRQLIVNAVMATDIMDKELKTLRNARWEKAFSESASICETIENTNRKATIVIEHLIQASDVAHTMQHWHIYRKWNERFFAECYKSFRQGRSETDPSIGWYQGEIGFLDFYVIPLAKKLKDCGVFGVSGDEYLNYAIDNRKEWEIRGQEIVSEMIEKVKKVYGPSAEGDKVALGIPGISATVESVLPTSRILV